MLGLFALVVAVLVVFAIAGMRTYLALANRSPDAEVLKHYTILLRHILLAFVVVSVALVGSGLDSGGLIERLSERTATGP